MTYDDVPAHPADALPPREAPPPAEEPGSRRLAA
jgi:hypothetical protein